MHRHGPVQGTVLVLTTAKNDAESVAAYLRNLAALTYPPDLLSLGILVSDTLDKTYEALRDAFSR
jgi:Anp1